MNMRFTVPGPPQPKQRARRGKYGRWYTPTRTRVYEKHVAHQAHFAAVESGWRLIEEKQVRMRVSIYWPDARRRDADNVVKAVADGVTKAGNVWSDDHLVLPSVERLEIDREHPRVEVEIEEVV